MPTHRLPVRPNLAQLKQQAKDLLRSLRAGEPEALAAWTEVARESIDVHNLKLATAQWLLARSYRAGSWARLVQACKLADAIWDDQPEVVRALVTKHPRLLRESVLIEERNWGPPLTYAANLGRDRIIDVLRACGAQDLSTALDRALLQGRVDTARRLHAMLGRPQLSADLLAGPAYTLNVAGTALALELGTPVCDAAGARLAPVAVVLESDSRNPQAKHAILELYVQHGLELPDTAPMAVHRGRIDLLERHLRSDPHLLSRQFSHEELYPPALGCHDAILATHGTPLSGATLLHLCVDYDELETARWLLARGMHVDARAAVDAEGFGGHTALFATVVSQPSFWSNRRAEHAAPFTQLLLERGADPTVRASLRKQLHPGYGPDSLHEYRDVTALAWGQRFHDRRFVNARALELIAARLGED